MALQTFNALGLIPAESSNLQKMMGDELENSFKRVRNKYAEPQAQADIAYKQAQAEKAQREGGLGGLTGSMGNAAKLYGLEQEHGSEHPLIQSLKRMQELEQAREQGLLDLNEANIQALPTRLLTPEGKRQNELEDLKKGNKLGSSITGKPEKLDPATANFQRAQYEMSMLKDITNPAQLDRMRASADVHTTLGLINKADAFRYSGTWGTVAKKAQEGLSGLTGKENEEYAAFEENKTRMQLLSKHLSRFFGAGAAEGIQEGIAYIADPNSWKYSPKVAERKFNALIDIYEAESQNLLRGVRTPSVYGAQSPGEYAPEAPSPQPDVNKVAQRMEQQGSNERILGITPKGKKVYVPADQLDEFIRNGGKRG